MPQPGRIQLRPEEVLERYSAGPQSGVFTDGSCEGNPGPGGWGVVWVEDGKILAERNGRDPATPTTAWSWRR